MRLVDHVLILILFVIQPLYGAWSWRRFLDGVRAGRAPNRPALYIQTHVLEWSAVIVLMAWWLLQGRSLESLGLAPPTGLGFNWGWLLLAALAFGLWLSGRRLVDAPAEEREHVIESLGDLQHFLPQSHRDYRHFSALSLTAGVCEELIYRGFVFWYLAHWMPTWLVVVVASIAFGLAHAYQGAGGMLRVAGVGLVLGGFYVFTGSLWLPMLAHVLIDLLQGHMIYRLFRRRDGVAPQTRPG